MKILFVSSEITPFAKTGGLADVAGALPKALGQLGHDVRVVMPAYKEISEGTPLNMPLTVSLNGSAQACTFRQTTLPGSIVSVYLVEHSDYFHRGQLYQDGGQDYPDNAERFAFYNLAALELVKQQNWQPDIIHCNDWQTALIPAYLRTRLQDDHFFSKTATVFTIHNLAYQGLSPLEKGKAIGLEPSLLSPEQLEFYGQLNLLKGGLVFSDVINTVSKKYSEEMQTKEFGCGLEGLLSQRKSDIFGILNGLDYSVWDPQADTDLVKTYSSSRLVDKKPNKEDLQKHFQLPVQPGVPVIGMVSRLDPQKGFDLIAHAMEQLLKLNVQFVLLGTGQPEYHAIFERLHHQYKDQMGLALKFDAALAKKIYAGSDMFLMPSRYEPCGLGQLISLKYGTVPIVRETGGLADTIIDYNQNKRSGNGFTFSAYNQAALIDTVQRAVATFREKTAWTKLMQRAMLADFSWEASAKEYVKLYKKAITRVKAKI